MDNNRIIDSIKKLCMQNDITITKLEEQLGMSQGLISRWAKSDPSLSKIVDIADYFHVSLDEVVGYHNVINDKFLEKLIQQTEDQIIKWNKYTADNNSKQPKQYNEDISNYEFISPQDAEEYFFNHTEISYYVEIQNTYISLYGSYDYQKILDPSDLKLFIQPNDDANLIEQHYSYEQIKVLWLKVIYSLGENAPDEIKAEEFKNAFINDFKKPEQKQHMVVKPVYISTNLLKTAQSPKTIKTTAKIVIPDKPTDGENKKTP